MINLVKLTALLFATLFFCESVSANDRVFSALEAITDHKLKATLENNLSKIPLRQGAPSPSSLSLTIWVDKSFSDRYPRGRRVLNDEVRGYNAVEDAVAENVRSLSALLNLYGIEITFSYDTLLVVSSSIAPSSRRAHLEFNALATCLNQSLNAEKGCEKIAIPLREGSDALPFIFIRGKSVTESVGGVAFIGVGAVLLWHGDSYHPADGSVILSEYDRHVFSHELLHVLGMTEHAPPYCDPYPSLFNAHYISSTPYSLLTAPKDTPCFAWQKDMIQQIHFVINQLSH